MQYILLHGKTVDPSRVKLVVNTIKATSKLLDDRDDVYLFEGDVDAAKEVIEGMIGDSR